MHTNSIPRNLPSPEWHEDGSQSTYAALPCEPAVRELRYKVHVKGSRVGEVTLATTFLDAAVYPASVLADLYHRQWQIELNFRHLKISVKMDILKCKTVKGVLKELAVFALVHNLVRSVMLALAGTQGISPERLSLLDALRWLVGGEGDEDLSVLLVNPGLDPAGSSPGW